MEVLISVLITPTGYITSVTACVLSPPNPSSKFDPSAWGCHGVLVELVGLHRSVGALHCMGSKILLVLALGFEVPWVSASCRLWLSTRFQWIAGCTLQMLLTRQGHNSIKASSD